MPHGIKSLSQEISLHLRLKDQRSLLALFMGNLVKGYLIISGISHVHKNLKIQINKMVQDDYEL